MVLQQANAKPGDNHRTRRAASRAAKRLAEEGVQQPPHQEAPELSWVVAERRERLDVFQKHDLELGRGFVESPMDSVEEPVRQKTAADWMKVVRLVECRLEVLVNPKLQWRVILRRRAAA